MKTPHPFSATLAISGVGWLATCAGVIGFVLVAEHFDRTRESSWCVIGAFVIWQGVVPFTRLARWLHVQNAKNRNALPHFIGLKIDAIPQLQKLDATNEGTAFGLVCWIARKFKDLGAEASTDVFCEELYSKIWQPALDRLLNCATQCSVIGFGYTLFGISMALRAGTDWTSGLGIMMESSLLGCIGGVLCAGLWLIAKRGVGAHEADLRKLSSQFGDNANDDDPRMLF